MPLALYFPPEVPAIVQPAAHFSTAPGPAFQRPVAPNAGMQPKAGSQGGPGVAKPNAAEPRKPPTRPQNTCQVPVGAPTNFCGILGSGGLS